MQGGGGYGLVARLPVLGAGAESAVCGEGHQREVDGVEVVLEVEDAREAGRGPLLVVPGTVAALAAQQVIDAALDRGAGARAGDTAGGEQSHQRPGGLRRGARPDAFQGRFVVGAGRLAPAAVGVLTRD